MKRNFISIITGICIGLLLRIFVFDIRKIEGRSMIPVLQPQSYIIENKLAYGLVKPFGSTFFVQWSTPKVGDIVLYVYNNHTVVKRCVAIEKEALEFSTDSGYSLYVHNTEIPLTEQQYQRIKHSASVPQGMILAIGDNYVESIDSREYGFVSVNNILGKVLWK